MTQDIITKPRRSTVEELWAVHERQSQEVDTLAAKHRALCEAVRRTSQRASKAFDAFQAADTKRRELFEAAYEAEYGHEFEDERPPLAAWRYI